MNPRHTSYWKIVCDCLVHFHGLSAERAQASIRDFRLKLASINEHVDVDLVYHQEPFYLAAQLAGYEAREPNEAEARQYEELLQRRMLEAAALGSDEEVISYPKGSRAA